MNIATCKTCRHWIKPGGNDHYGQAVCDPQDPDSFEPMDRTFETRTCTHPSQARFEAPVAANSFALTDASNFYAVLATGEDFGCRLHQALEGASPVPNVLADLVRDALTRILKGCKGTLSGNQLSLIRMELETAFQTDLSKSLFDSAHGKPDAETKKPL